MRKLIVSLLAVLTCVVIALPLAAQEGFPLKGTWLGDWGAGTSRNQVFVVFDWDGKVISGSINPGTETIAVKNASLTPTPVAPPPAAAAAVPPPAAAPAAPAAAGAAPAAGAGGGRGGQGGRGGNGAGASVAAPPVEWIVHFEADGKDSKGATVHYVVDGKIENIGLYNRSLSGTWVSGTTKGTFKMARQ
jgi:hypothetical protein